MYNHEGDGLSHDLLENGECIVKKRMNPLHYLIPILCIIFLLCAGAAASGQLESQVQHSDQGNISGILSVPSVQSILEKPEEFYGKTVSFRGVVSKSYSRKHQFSIADRVGCSLCTAKNAKNSILIRYDGEIPKYRDIVQITGEVISETSTRYHINATSVET